MASLSKRVATAATLKPADPTFDRVAGPGAFSVDGRPRRRYGLCRAARSAAYQRVDSIRGGPPSFWACGDNRGMRVLPTGTITMFFSDIEGSTGLLGRLGDRYGEALSAQRALLRAAFAACRGHEMGTEGDSFFVVFESAGDAVRCCVAAQGALSRHEW